MARTALYDRQIALDKALSLFWKRGYNGTSMKQIEQALDMRPGSIYAAFGSKDGLFREVMEVYADRAREDLEAHLADYDSVVDGLKDYLRNIASACAPGTTTPSRACMIIKTLLELSNTHESLAGQTNRILAGIEQGFVELLEQAKNRGELTSGTDCPRLARLLQAQIIGLRSFAQRDTRARHVLELGDDMAAILDLYRVRH